MKLKKNKLLWLGLILMLFAIGTYAMTHANKKEKMNFHEEKVMREDFTATIVSTGTVAPENRLEIKPPVVGRMERLLVKEGQRVQKGQVLAWVSSTERAAMLDSARAEGEASLKQWETFYKPTPIYAPINGVIILQNIWSGQSFGLSDSLLTMSDRLTVKAQVDETDIAKVSLNQDALVTLDAYPNVQIEAKVVHVAFDSKSINSVTTYIVDVLPKLVPKTMLSGMTANVTFILNSIPRALFVPNEAIQIENGVTCVKLKPATETDAVNCKKVTVGPVSNGKTVIMEGLNEEEFILIPELNSISAKNQDSSKNLFFNGPKSGPRPGQNGGPSGGGKGGFH